MVAWRRVVTFIVLHASLTLGAFALGLFLGQYFYYNLPGGTELGRIGFREYGVKGAQFYSMIILGIIIAVAGLPANYWTEWGPRSAIESSFLNKDSFVASLVGSGLTLIAIALTIVA